jgi:hemin uptake protein HemP
VNNKIVSPTQNECTGPRPPDLPARVSSESLLGPRGELLIVHNGREYRLRLTQNGKLILTA